MTSTEKLSALRARVLAMSNDALVAECERLAHRVGFLELEKEDLCEQLEREREYRMVVQAVVIE